MKFPSLLETGVLVKGVLVMDILHILLLQMRLLKSVWKYWPRCKAIL